MAPDNWAAAASATLAATRDTDTPTPLRQYPLPGDSTVELFVKDESARPTGSLKYGPARSLLVDAIRRGDVADGTPLVEATSGNLAVAEAYFARLLGLPFTAVVPRGIGRPRLEPAFDPEAVDLVIPVRDAHSVAAMRHLRDITGRTAGPSTGACLFGAFHLVARLRENRQPGVVVIVQGDSGTPYADTYYDDAWVAARGWDLAEPTALLRRYAAEGIWDPPTAAARPT
ncbi:pyridoxal-phosphate dependent enzyme [Nocardia sp. BMG51109]|uniref:pyridoxal-phosphate dependent enzyme n=1 Tax=Nocardia sp. BMG51109 TaxID=1056816 RepID=UPI000466F3FE|nr:pyridoxal-phosphate dependent enzyme [Nocardia sp. BMG51109]